MMREKDKFYDDLSYFKNFLFSLDILQIGRAHV